MASEPSLGPEATSSATSSRLLPEALRRGRRLETLGARESQWIKSIQHVPKGQFQKEM